MRLLFAVLLVTALLAGCGSKPAATSTSPAPIMDSSLWTQPVKVGTGGEPGLRLAGNGTVYIHVPGDLFVSHDDGATWTSLADNLNAAGPVLGGDADLAIGKDGTLYYSDLEELAALSVYASQDGGKSWTENPDASVLPGDDRQWLEVGPDAGPLASSHEALYLVFNNQATNVVASKSTDGGKTWVALPVNKGLQTQFWSQGNLVVDPKDGTVWITYDLGNAARPNGDGVLPATNEVQVAKSTDGGLTWTLAPVYTASGTDDTGQIFPVIAQDAAGHLYVTFALLHDGHSDIMLSTSSDKGASWSKPVKVNQGAQTAVQPWVDAMGDGRIAVAYYGANESAAPGAVKGDWHVYLATAPDGMAAQPTFTEGLAAQAPNHKGGICTVGIMCGTPGSSGSRALLDFFQVRLDGKGKAHIVYADTVHHGVFYVSQTRSMLE